MSTTAGSVSTVAKPLGEVAKRPQVAGLQPASKVMSGKAKKKGPYANSLSESKKRVEEAELSEDDIILVPGQGRLRKSGFVKNDPDRAEHEGETLKNSLHTIMRVAKELDRELSTRDNFPEWVSEKIGATKGMIVSVADYLMSSKEMQHDTDAMECGGGVIAGGSVGYEESVEESAEFGSNYAEQLAQEVFNHNPNISSEDEVLNLGYNISKSDLGSRASGIFRSEDFPSDFVSAYFWLKKNQSITETHDDDDYEDCSWCSGSGEGQHEGSRCSHCHGTGVEPASENDDDIDDIDYEDDADYDEPESHYEKSLRTRGLGEGQRWPDSSNSLAKRSAVATNLKGAPSKAGRGSGMTVATRVDPTITSTTVKRKDSDRPIPKSLQKEGAKVDRMVKHITKSEKKLGHTKKEAENIAWATANKRGMLDNKNKKK